MAWIAAAAVILGIIYYLSKDDEQPRCPNCKSFVRKHSSHCPRCRARLGWE